MLGIRSVLVSTSLSLRIDWRWIKITSNSSRRYQTSWHFIFLVFCLISFIFFFVYQAGRLPIHHAARGGAVAVVSFMILLEPSLATRIDRVSLLNIELKTRDLFWAWYSLVPHTFLLFSPPYPLSFTGTSRCHPYSCTILLSRTSTTSFRTHTWVIHKWAPRMFSYVSPDDIFLLSYLFIFAMPFPIPTLPPFVSNHFLLILCISISGGQPQRVETGASLASIWCVFSSPTLLFV